MALPFKEPLTLAKMIAISSPKMSAAFANAAITLAPWAKQQKLVLDQELLTEGKGSVQLTSLY